MRIEEARAYLERELGPAEHWRGNMGAEYYSWGDKLRECPTLVLCSDKGRVEAWVLNCAKYVRVLVQDEYDIDDVLDVFRRG